MLSLLLMTFCQLVFNLQEIQNLQIDPSGHAIIYDILLPLEVYVIVSPRYQLTVAAHPDAFDLGRHHFVWLLSNRRAYANCRATAKLLHRANNGRAVAGRDQSCAALAHQQLPEEQL